MPKVALNKVATLQEPYASRPWNTSARTPAGSACCRGLRVSGGLFKLAVAGSILGRLGRTGAAR